MLRVSRDRIWCCRLRDVFFSSSTPKKLGVSNDVDWSLLEGRDGAVWRSPAGKSIEHFEFRVSSEMLTVERTLQRQSSFLFLFLALKTLHICLPSSCFITLFVFHLSGTSTCLSTCPTGIGHVNTIQSSVIWTFRYMELSSFTSYVISCLVTSYQLSSIVHTSTLQVVKWPHENSHGLFTFLLICFF